MRTRKGIVSFVAVIFSFALGIQIALLAAETTGDSEQLKSVPSDALGVWHVRDIPKMMSDLQNSVLYKALLRFINSGSLQEAKKNNPKEFELIENLLTTVPRDLPKALKGEFTVALIDLGIQTGQPTAVAIADADEKAFDEFVGKTILPSLMELSGTELAINTSDKTKRIGPADSPIGLFYMMDEGRMLLTPFENSFGSVKSVSEPLANNPLFNSTFEKHISSPDSLMFLNFRKLLDIFATAGAPLPEYLNIAGIQSIAAIGYSSIIAENGGLTELTMYAPEGLKGGLALLKGRGTEPAVEKYIPEDYSFFLKISVGNLHQFYKDLVALLEQNEEAIGGFSELIKEIEREFGISIEKDMLANLRGEIAFAAKAPKVIGIPEMAAFIEVKNKENIEKILKKLVVKHVSFIAGEYKGIKIESANVMMVQLSYAFVGNYLVVADSPAIIRDVIDANANGRCLLTRKDYQTVFAKLPSKGFITCYIDMKEAFNSLVPLINMGMRHVKLVSDALLALQVSMQDTPGIGFVLVADDKSVSVKSFCGLGTVETTLPVLAGIVLTAHSVEKAHLRKAAPINNIKQLCLAAKQYANDNAEVFPDTFSVLYPDYCSSMKVLQDPSSKTERIKNEQDIDKLCDYEIVKGLTEAADSDTILVYEKQQFTEGGRNVGFVDGRARWMSEDEFQKTLKEQADKRKKAETSSEDEKGE